MRVLMCVLVLCACGPAPGRLTLTASGAGDFTSVDGYAVHFTRAAMVVSEFALATSTDQQGPKTGGELDVDLLAPPPNLVRIFDSVPAQRWDAVSWSLGNDGGVSFELEGTIVKDNTNKTFAWSFNTDTLYSHCGQGITIHSEGTTSAELSVRAERLWNDSLLDAGTLQGAAIFDADTGDSIITLDELGATFVPATYDPPLPGNSMRDFLTAQVRTIGGFQGDYSCTVTAR